MDIFLSGFNFKDLIDIGVVAIFIYQVILIVRGTRAMQMLFGVAGLGILFWIGVSYKLHTLNWILQHFFDSFFIILVILFQDQIRAALASFGSGRKVFGGFNSAETSQEIDEIVEVCGALSRRRIGALVVFERLHGLKNYIATGTLMDSVVHSDLIYAIFQSTSPLHDGAIVISKGKIAAAGCFLPLSKNVDVDRHLGTRHRAALGISEATDAIAVTVSEETGKISVAIAGQFFVAKGKIELARMLKRIAGTKAGDVKSQLEEGGL